MWREILKLAKYPTDPTVWKQRGNTNSICDHLWRMTLALRGKLSWSLRMFGKTPHINRQSKKVPCDVLLNETFPWRSQKIASEHSTFLIHIVKSAKGLRASLLKRMLSNVGCPIKRVKAQNSLVGWWPCQAYSATSLLLPPWIWNMHRIVQVSRCGNHLRILRYLKDPSCHLNGLLFGICQPWWLGSAARPSAISKKMASAGNGIPVNLSTIWSKIASVL